MYVNELGIPPADYLVNFVLCAKMSRKNPDTKGTIFKNYKPQRSITNL